MSDQDNKEISETFLELAKNEFKIESIDKEVEQFKIRKMESAYNERDTLIEKIPSFWKIVLSQHLDFANYIRASDFKYIDAIEKITVKYASDIEKIGSFSITFHFNEIKDDLPEQIITKKFKLVKIGPKQRSDEEGEDDNTKETELDDIESDERLISEVCDIEWPKEYNSINPDLIEDKKSPEGKKNYRQGMKSFFGWFRWTGLKPGKEFPHGDSLATLLSEDLYPYCVKYYTEAQRDFADEDSYSDDTSEEGIDLSEEEQDNDEEPAKKKIHTS
ncbi:similar to Saccharomyces cerevisiae YNL246W VPS75 NAP family histone chaperone [Maudiozyma saulgeensis]|uniref:Similar to Saccharomyces cerevisiae YNL246W VPS75 NAP family histone chaperone n=1 Tax=Maudiozyma saulgeensis TaxID=1789683 RepID=A0A1X7R2R8_9SACH|nr:similar to Saccharomyces cerevisiae YNL246W VPS75 NAP family histone chaperone [Kazachstania saulgeensis]